MFLEKHKVYEAVIVLYIKKINGIKINDTAHVVINKQYLGVQFLSEIKVGRNDNVLFEAFYEKCELKIDSLFVLEEDSNKIGIGRVTKIYEK